MKFSYNILGNIHLFGYCLNLYENLMEKLLMKNSVAALCLFKHFIMNNINKLLKPQTSLTPTATNYSNIGELLMLESLLTQLSNIFMPEQLVYFLKNYDWNYLEHSICLEALHLIY